MTGILWGMAGAMSAVGLEYLYRTWPVSWWHMLPVVLVLQLVVSRSIYEIVTGDSILAVSIFFSGATSLLRVAATLHAGDSVDTVTWAAFSLAMMAMGVKIAGRLVE